MLKYVLKNVFIGMLLVFALVGIMFTLIEIGLSFELSCLITSILGIISIGLFSYGAYKGLDISVTKIK